MAAAIFIVSYLLFLVLWIAVKNTYGYAITSTVSHFTAMVKGVLIESITRGGDMLKVTFSKHAYMGTAVAEVPVKTSAYTFNAPLTYAIMATLYPFTKKRKRAYLEAIVALLFIHSLFVFSLELRMLTELFMGKGLEPMSKAKLILYQFLWSFTDNMVIRFEPFLIGFYLFLRFRKDKTPHEL